jgi:hypothetical protein
MLPPLVSDSIVRQIQNLLMILATPAINTSRPDYSPPQTNHFYLPYVNLIRRRPHNPRHLSFQLVSFARGLLSISVPSPIISPKKNMPTFVQTGNERLRDSMCSAKNKIDRKVRITTDAVLSPPWPRCATSTCSTFVPRRTKLAKVLSPFLSPLSMVGHAAAEVRPTKLQRMFLF